MYQVNDHDGRGTRLRYLRAGHLSDREIPNVLTKYATIVKAYELSR
jgi:hypothetical protein